MSRYTRKSQVLFTPEQYEMIEEVARQQGNPSASSLLRDLLAELPNAILTDSGADWSFWAGTSFP